MSNVTEPSPPRWLKPMNRLVLALGRIGVPAGPSQVLTVPGRKSGQPRSTPMTPFDHDGGLYTVAGYAESGRFSEAIETAQAALQLATAQGNSALIEDLQLNIGNYRRNLPLRDPGAWNKPPALLQRDDQE